VILIATGTAEEDGSEVTESQLAAAETLAKSGDEGVVVDSGLDEVKEGVLDDDDKEVSKVVKGSKIAWRMCSSETQERRHGAVVGPRVRLEFSDTVLSVVWHYKGDYLASLTASSGSDSVSIHQVIFILKCSKA
jgi:hypothetical protein